MPETIMRYNLIDGLMQGMTKREAIVRCGNCKNWDESTQECCLNDRVLWSKKDFCSMAQRKD